MQTMTTKQAREIGYVVSRGAYQGTCDDRLDRWYVYPASGPIDRRGIGYRTRQEALDALARMLPAITAG